MLWADALAKPLRPISSLFLCVGSWNRTAGTTCCYLCYCDLCITCSSGIDVFNFAFPSRLCYQAAHQKSIGQILNMSRTLTKLTGKWLLPPLPRFSYFLFGYILSHFFPPPQAICYSSHPLWMAGWQFPCLTWLYRERCWCSWKASLASGLMLHNQPTLFFPAPRYREVF